ncbi:GGDEF domain-containing protein [Paraburkholderia hospita]|uniref:GGDEF domain-containing protein n=1 Tax=Paraburkholderia hospita TaxID=169430 RepID=UPI001F624B9E|nr:GGDEF domain-containing protein [Paraburkholderia hospita]
MLIARFVMARVKSRLNDAERRLEYLALTDPLTDLPNRRAFFAELERRVDLAVALESTADIRADRRRRLQDGQRHAWAWGTFRVSPGDGVLL